MKLDLCLLNLLKIDDLCPWKNKCQRNENVVCKYMVRIRNILMMVIKIRLQDQIIKIYLQIEGPEMMFSAIIKFT